MLLVSVASYFLCKSGARDVQLDHWCMMIFHRSNTFKLAKSPFMVNTMSIYFGNVIYRLAKVLKVLAPHPWYGT